MLLALAALAVASADTNCTWSWKALGCVPSKECKLKWQPRFGSFGPCVLRPPAEAKEPSNETAAVEEAAPAEPVDTPAEPTEPTEATKEASEDEVEVSDAKDEP